MLYARVVRSPHPHARRSSSIDFSAAQRVPGFKASLHRARSERRAERACVMYQGDEVAAVAADTEEHAIDAARR